jgi:O-antigen/teichoic acid export membrane protein
MTITTMVTLIGIADLGINNSLVNSASSASGQGDYKKIRISISNAIVGLSAISVLIIIAAILANITLNWEKLFNLKDDIAKSEAGSAILIFIIIFALSQPVTVAQKILIGLQKGWIANIWIAIGQFAGIIFLWISINNKAGLPVLIAALMGPQLIINILGSIAFFIMNKKLAPKIEDISEKKLKELFLSGGLFFLIQVMSLIGSASDNIIIAHMLGANSVSEYSVVQKLSTIFGIAQLFISPLWPAFGEAISRGDYKWAISTFKKVVFLSALTSLTTGAVMISAGESIIEKWTNGIVYPSQSMLIGFSVFLLVASIGGCFSTLLNNPDFIHKQALIYTIASFISVILKIVLIDTYQSASGAIWGAIIGYTIFFIIPGIKVVSSFFKEKRYERNLEWSNK